MIHREHLEKSTRGRGTVEIGSDVAAVIRRSAIRDGVCHLFCVHTSASLTITENADPAVRRDLERAMARIAPDGADYEHDAEGPDDMAAHVRAVLTRPDLVIPVADGEPVLGTWQGIYLWEHRVHGSTRTVFVTVIGE
jgi:secondary thiamine-phosphate synthase enzyme